MKKTVILLLLFFTSIIVQAQVGINTTTPNAQLDIRSSNQATPTNTDGILIPKVDTFPATNPTAAQQGMLVYLTTTSGTDLPGFYYWDNVTVDWKPIAGNSGGTLDQAYDFGGPGLGRTITPDTGAVTINGTDGMVSTGTLGIGATSPSGAGTKMFWNPRKAAFRVGEIGSTEWDDFNIGQRSIAFGGNTTASGNNATAFGFETLANNNYSTAFGFSTIASGDTSTAFGYDTTASGLYSTAFGYSSSATGNVNTVFGYLNTANGSAYATAFGALNGASGQNSTVFGRNNLARSYGETVLGLGATNYVASSNGNTQFRPANATDRLFVIGNAIDSNNNDLMDESERSDAMIVLKNGLTRLPSTTNAMITAADGKAVVTKEYLQSNTSGTLDQAYDFGGAGSGRTITADTGAVTIDGTDGLVSTGTIGTGALAPTGAGVRMVWNPRKAAFRAGHVFGTEWDDANMGAGSVALGYNVRSSGDSSFSSGAYTTASGPYATAFGYLTIASGYASTALGFQSFSSGNTSTAFGNNTDATGDYATAFGYSSTASGMASTAFNSQSSAGGDYSTAFGQFSSANGDYSTAFGRFSFANGDYSTVSGSDNNANGSVSNAFGKNNTAHSYAETVIGIGATNYFPSTNGATQFRAANATDRLFVIGNAIDANNNNIVDGLENSDAMIVLKNGLTRLPSTTNAMITAADGKAVVTKEYLQSNTSGTLDQAYDFGGAGLGRTITADTGAVTINGTDGLVSNGTFGSGAVAPSGNGSKMYWNPRKAAFRAGGIISNDWDDSNVGDYSVAFNEGTRSTGRASFATGGYNFALANYAQVAGYQNTAFSYGETVLGIGATFYTSSVNGTTQFRATNATDRLFVIGNAIDANNNTVVDNAERSDAMVVLKNGNTGFGTSTPLNRLHVVGNIRMVDGNQAAGRVLTSDVNGVATWQNASTNAWGLLGNAGTNATTNFLGTTDNVDLVFRRNNIQSGRIGETNSFLGTNSGIVNTGQYNTFIGERSGIANATGNDNTFIGRLAGANGTFGNDNSYLGYAAGLNNTGNSNLILGAFASQNTTGNFNVFVGNLSGSNNTTGTRNTILGYNAEVGAGNLSNATAIGNLAQVNTSNSLVLGSINGVNGSLVSTNVGIGTTSPLTRLDVVDENTITANLTYGNLHVRSNNAQNIDVGGAITLGGYNDDTMVQPRVFGSVEGRKSNATTNSSSGYLIFKTNNAGTLAERMRITNTGNVGVGIPNPLGLFELAIDQGRKPGTNTWTIVSDARLKTINGNYTKGLNEILQLHPIRFNYKNNGERVFEKEVLDTEYPGFIAQEVQPLFPDAVGTDADGFLNFNIHPILIASVNAIKELNAKNESLQTENESLKAELNQQKAQLELVMQRLSVLEKK